MRRRLASALLAASFCAPLILPFAARAAETITIGSLSDPGYEAALWALQNGKVTDPGITVKVEEMPIPALIQAAMTQQYNVIALGVLQVPQMAESGLNVKMISTLLRYHPDGHADDIWVLADSPIKTVADLKGKTIAVPSSEAQNVVSLRAIMSERCRARRSSPTCMAARCRRSCGAPIPPTSRNGRPPTSRWSS
jgi:ABC-type nitrate/sulfonate/bicarbonate transport system substrate-binding protein